MIAKVGQFQLLSKKKCVRTHLIHLEYLVQTGFFYCKHAKSIAHETTSHKIIALWNENFVD